MFIREAFEREFKRLVDHETFCTDATAATVLFDQLTEINMEMETEMKMDEQEEIVLSPKIKDIIQEVKKAAKDIRSHKGATASGQIAQKDAGIIAKKLEAALETCAKKTPKRLNEVACFTLSTLVAYANWFSKNDNHSSTRLHEVVAAVRSAVISENWNKAIDVAKNISSQNGKKFGPQVRDGVLAPMRSRMRALR